MGAKKLLYDLQRKYNRYHGNDQTDYEEMRTVLAKVMGNVFNEERFQESYMQQKQFLESMPTPYQDELFFSYIRDSIAFLSDFVSQNQQLRFYGKEVILKPVPLFGTLESSKLNAFVAIVDNEPLIVINEGLIELLYGLSPLVAANMLYGHNNPAVQEEIIRHYIDFVMCSLFYHPRFAELWELHHDTDEDFTIFSQDIFYTALSFVFSHEFSHLLLGHIGKTKSIIVNGIKVDTKYFTWLQEYDADLLGARLTLARKPLTKFMGIFLSLESLFLCSEYSSSQETKTHPPLYERVENIRKYARHSGYGQVSCYMFEMIVEPMAVQFNCFLEYLAEKKKRLTADSREEIQRLIYNDFPIIPQKSIFTS